MCMLRRNRLPRGCVLSVSKAAFTAAEIGWEAENKVRSNDEGEIRSAIYYNTAPYSCGVGWDTYDSNWYVGDSLCYKPEGRGFHPPRCPHIFQLT
jgi:hypothetical protein